MENVVNKTSSFLFDQKEILAQWGEESVSLDVEKLSEDVKEYAMYFGLFVRLRNATAGAKGDAAKAAEAQKLVDYYESGTAQWEMRAAGGAGMDGMILRAFAATYRMDVEAAKAKAEGIAKAKGVSISALLAKLAEAPEVAAKLAELRGATGLDADDVLADMMA